MSQIQIGNMLEGKPVKLDLPTLLRTHLQIQGASGSGKSWLVRLLAEQLSGKVPVIIIDQEGEYATLREKFDYILVGKGGETATNVQSAGLLSQRLLELRASAICDLYDLDVSTRKTWIRKFFEGVMSAPKKHWRPTIFIIDEAHDFIPEKSESECAHILASAISKGRKRGFAFICATQRLSKLNKDVASELQNVLIGKTWLDIDRERGAAALGIYSRLDKETFFEECKRLEQGQFYAQGAAVSLDRILFHTGAVQTTHPDSSNVTNKKKWLVPPPAPKAVAELLGKLGDLPKEAAEEAVTVSDLKHKIIQLQHQLKTQPKVVPQLLNSAARTDKLANLQAKQKSLQEEISTLKIFAKAIMVMLKKKNDQMTEAAAALLLGTGVKIQMPKLPEMPEIKHGSTVPQIPSIHKPAHVVKLPVQIPKTLSVYQVSKTVETAVGSELNNKQFHILRALAEFKAIGRLSVPRTWVAARSGASHRSSAYANNVSNLRSRGLVEYTPDGLALTYQGEEIAPVIEAPLTTDGMLHSCLKMCNNRVALILKFLHGIYPESASREDVAQNSDASPLSSAFTNNVSALKSAGMITYQSDRSLRAADWLFID